MKNKNMATDLARFLIPVSAIIIAFLIGAGLILLAGLNPIAAYKAMFRSAFGNINNIGETLIKMVPLLLAGLGTAVAIRAKIFNIGAEGQIQMGALGAAVAGIFLVDLPPALGIVLTLLFGFIAGALWGGIAGLIKIRFKVNEIIVTLMMNYIAIGILSYLVTGPWRDPKSTEPYTAMFADSSILPVILPGTRLHAGFLVALLATIALAWIFRKTVYGYQSIILGSNERAAEYAGIKTGSVIFITMLISGGLAGLAGVGEVAGVHHRVLQGFSPGYGYTAIAIALLGRLNPYGIFAASFLFAALVVGADGMQLFVGVPVSLVLIIEGLVLFLLLASEIIMKRTRLDQDCDEIEA